MQHFTLKLHKIHLLAGVCPDPMEELTACPRPPWWIFWVGWEKRGKGGREKGGVFVEVRPL